MRMCVYICVCVSLYSKPKCIDIILAITLLTILNFRVLKVCYAFLVVRV